MNLYMCMHKASQKLKVTSIMQTAYATFIQRLIVDHSWMRSQKKRKHLLHWDGTSPKILHGQQLF